MHELLVRRGQRAQEVGLPHLHALVGQETIRLGRALFGTEQAGRCLLRSIRFLQEQLIAALGLADIVRHQRQMGGQRRGEIQEIFRLALHQFKFHL